MFTISLKLLELVGVALCLNRGRLSSRRFGAGCWGTLWLLF
jgi:hypothetical protein